MRKLIALTLFVCAAAFLTAAWMEKRAYPDDTAQRINISFGVVIGEKKVENGELEIETDRLEVENNHMEHKRNDGSKLRRALVQLATDKATFAEASRRQASEIPEDTRGELEKAVAGLATGIASITILWYRRRTSNKIFANSK